MTNLPLCSSLLASCLPSLNPKWHLGAKRNQQQKSEIKQFYQRDKGKQRLCSVMDSEIAGAVGWGGLWGREDKAEEEERGGRMRAMALWSFLLNPWFALDLQTHAELERLQNPWGRWCWSYPAPCCDADTFSRGVRWARGCSRDPHRVW